MKKILIITALSALLAGCSTTSSTVFEYDLSGKVTRKTVISEKDVVDKITASVKDKTVIVWSNGWEASILASMTTMENPTPILKITASKVAKGYMSVVKDQQNLDSIAGVISATHGKIEISKSGIEEK